MTGPFVRLLGDKGLASRYVRQAKQLLAKVHGIRRETGVPIFAMRRALLGAGVFLQAASFGAIDVITITAEPSLAGPGADGHRNVLAPGVVFRHDTAWEDRYQGIVAPIIGGGLGEATYFNAPWAGPGAMNGVRLQAVATGLGAPAYIDETFMDSITSHSYNSAHYAHVTTTYNKVFVGGVCVLEAAFDADVYMTGARIYDTVLAVAYVAQSSNRLVVRYFPIAGLVYEGAIVHDPSKDSDPSVPSLAVPHEVLDNIFDFHPHRMTEGTFLIGNTATRGTPGNVESVMAYTFGKYVFDPEASAPEDHFVVEAQTEAVCGKNIDHAGSGGELHITSTHSTSVSGTITNPGGAFTPYGVYTGLTYPAVAPLWYSGEARGAGVPIAENPVEADWLPGISYSAYPGEPPDLTGTVSGTYTSAGGFSMNRESSVAVEVLNLPIWTGYGPDGTRYCRKLDGNAQKTVSGSNTFAFTLNESCTRTEVLKEMHPNGFTYHPPSGGSPGFWTWDVRLRRTYSGGYSASRGQTMNSVESLDQSESTTCTLYADEGDGSGWQHRGEVQVADVSNVRSGRAPMEAKSTYRRLHAPFADRVVIAELHGEVQTSSGYTLLPSSGRFLATRLDGNPEDEYTLSGEIPFAYRYGLSVGTQEVYPPYGNGSDPPSYVGRHQGAIIRSSQGGATAQSGDLSPTLFSDQEARVGRLYFFGDGVSRGIPWVRTTPDPFYPEDHAGGGYSSADHWHPGGEVFFGATGNGTDRLVSPTPPCRPYDIRLQYPTSSNTNISITEARIGNRIVFSGCLYLEPIDKHVVTPNFVFGADVNEDSRSREVYLLAGGAENITPTLNAAKISELPSGSTAVAPNITVDPEFGEIAVACGLY